MCGKEEKGDEPMQVSVSRQAEPPPSANYALVTLSPSLGPTAPVSCQYNWGRFPTFALPLPSHTEEALISVKLPSLSATDATQCTQPPILSNEVALYIQTYRCQTLATNIFTSCRSTFSSIIYCKPFLWFCDCWKPVL